MTRHLAITISAFALLTAPALFSAQARSTPQEPAHKTMRLTGCMQAGADAATFKLTHAREVTSQGSPSAPPAPIGTASQSREYELMPAADIDLKLSTHIDHRVEITVRPIELSRGVKPQPAPGGADLVAPVPPSQDPAERVIVTAVTHLASSCP